MPWQGGVGGRRRRATPLAYSTMTVDDICALPVGELAGPVCALWLWVPAAFNRRGDGVKVAQAWGFRVSGEIVWHKPNFGMGHVPRLCHEMVLVCSRGVGALTGPRAIRSVQSWAQPYSRGKSHSAKPPAAFDLIEQCSPGPYLELFARQGRLGWDTWGHGFEGQGGHAIARGGVPR